MVKAIGMLIGLAGTIWTASIGCGLIALSALDEPRNPLGTDWVISIPMAVFGFWLVYRKTGGPSS